MNKKNTQIILIIFVFLLLFSFSSGASADAMKIAVAATGQTKDASISKETGRAPFFLFFDSKGHFLEAMKNPAKDQYGGISRAVTSLLVNKGVTLVVAENIGDKMKQALNDHHIKYIKQAGAADNSVQIIMQNRQQQ